MRLFKSDNTHQTNTPLHIGAVSSDQSSKKAKAADPSEVGGQAFNLTRKAGSESIDNDLAKLKGTNARLATELQKHTKSLRPGFLTEEGNVKVGSEILKNVFGRSNPRALLDIGKIESTLKELGVEDPQIKVHTNFSARIRQSQVAIEISPENLQLLLDYGDIKNNGKALAPEGLSAVKVQNAQLNLQADAQKIPASSFAVRAFLQSAAPGNKGVVTNDQILAAVKEHLKTHDLDPDCAKMDANGVITMPREEARTLLCPFMEDPVYQLDLDKMDLSKPRYQTILKPETKLDVARSALKGAIMSSLVYRSGDELLEGAQKLGMQEPRFLEVKNTQALVGTVFDAESGKPSFRLTFRGSEAPGSGDWATNFKAIPNYIEVPDGKGGVEYLALHDGDFDYVTNVLQPLLQYVLEQGPKLMAMGFEPKDIGFVVDGHSLGGAAGECFSIIQAVFNSWNGQDFDLQSNALTTQIEALIDLMKEKLTGRGELLPTAASLGDATQAGGLTSDQLEAIFLRPLHQLNTIGKPRDTTTPELAREVIGRLDTNITQTVNNDDIVPKVGAPGARHLPPDDKNQVFYFNEHAGLETNAPFREWGDDRLDLGDAIGDHSTPYYIRLLEVQVDILEREQAEQGIA